MARPRVNQKNPAGINVIGYLETPSGIGEVARRFLRALEISEAPCRAHSVSPPGVYSHSRLPGPVFETNIYFVNADSIRSVKRGLPEELTGPAREIAVWFWELETFPADFASAYDAVDEIWVFSVFIRDTLAKVAKIPVRLMPIPFFAEEIPASDLKAQSGTNEAAGSFDVFYSFDYASDYHRKNPEGAVRIFREAFGDDPGVRLSIKSVNGGRFSRERDQLLRLIGADTRISIVDEAWSGAEVRQAIAGCDLLISPHRSEGLGLNIIDAINLEKPVLATAYGGNMTYMAEEHIFQIDFALQPVAAVLDVYRIDCRWAEPDISNGAGRMRFIRENYLEAVSAIRGVKRRLVEKYAPRILAEQALDYARRTGGGGMSPDRRSAYFPLEALETIIPSARILLVNSVRWEPLAAIFSFFRARIPGAAIDVIGAPDDRVAQHAEAFFRCQEGKSLSAGRIPEGVITAVKAKNHDLAIVPFFNFAGDGYENVFEIIDLTGIDRVLGIGREGDLFAVRAVDALKHDVSRIVDEKMLRAVLS